MSCQYKTAEGKQCSRKANNANFCWQHQKKCTEITTSQKESAQERIMSENYVNRLLTNPPTKVKVGDFYLPGMILRSKTAREHFNVNWIPDTSKNASILRFDKIGDTYTTTIAKGEEFNFVVEQNITREEIVDRIEKILKIVKYV